MKLKRINQTAAVLLTAAALAAQPAYSTGIPVYDGAQSIFSAWYQTFLNVKQVYHWSQELRNWDSNLKNYLRGRISKLLGINLSDQFSMEDLERLLQKRKSRCNGLGNSDSRALCNETIGIEIKKVQVYQKMESMIQQNYTQLEKLVNEYESVRTQNDSSGKADSKQKEIMTHIQNFESKLKIYEQQLKMLDMQQDMLQKARAEVARDQIRSTNAARAAVQTAVFGALKLEAKDYKSKANDLRKLNSSTSNSSYSR